MISDPLDDNSTDIDEEPQGTMSVTEFYDRLAPFYHLIYPDWDQSIRRQATALASVIGEFWPTANDILDAACGIGTQALGLAIWGYTVTASDISPQSIARASAEAQKRNLSIAFSVADIRLAYTTHLKEFDVSLACDNAIAHLLSDDEILTALRELHRCTKAGGGCILSIRDYDAIDRNGIQLKPYPVQNDGGTRRLLWQVWEFEDSVYKQDMYFLEDHGGTDVRTQVVRSMSYAVSIETVIKLMRQAGFDNVRRLDERFFQPLIIGTKP